MYVENQENTVSQISVKTKLLIHNTAIVSSDWYLNGGIYSSRLVTYSIRCWI